MAKLEAKPELTNLNGQTYSETVNLEDFDEFSREIYFTLRLKCPLSDID